MATGTPLEDVREELEELLSRIGEASGTDAVALTVRVGDTERCAIGSLPGADPTGVLGPPVTDGGRQLVAIEDAAADERLREHPLVRAGARRYLAVPVRVDGIAIGSVTAIAPQPGTFDAEVLMSVRRLARHVELLLEATYHRQEHHRLRTEHAHVVSATGVAVWEFDAEGRTLSANEALGRLLGVPADQLVGRSVLEFVPAEDAAAVRKRRDRRGEGLTETHPSRFVRPDGEIRHTVTTAAPLLAADGTMRGTSAILVDVTDEVRAAEQLAESERQLASLVERLPGVVYVCEDDERYTIRYVSRGARRLFGVDPQELVGRGFADLTHPDEVDRVVQEVREAIASGVPYNLTYRMLRDDGAVRWIWEQGSPIPETGLLEGLMLDVTEQMDAAEALRASEERLRQLAERLDELVLVVVGGRVTFANLAAARALGVSPSGLIGRRYDALVHPDDRIHVDALHRRAGRSRDGRSLVGIYRLVADDDEVIEVRARTTGVPSGGEPTLHVVAQDLGRVRGIERYRSKSRELLTRAARGEVPVDLERELVSLAGERLRRRDLSLVRVDGTEIELIASTLDEGIPDQLAALALAGSDLGSGTVVDVTGAPPGRDGPGPADWCLAVARRAGDERHALVLHGPADAPVTPEDRELLTDVAALVEAIDAALATPTGAGMGRDEVTSLPDRAALIALLEDELRSGSGDVRLVCLGIDGFGQVEATFGHATGELLLRRVGEHLTAALRPGELLARIGGDEFVVMDPGGGLDGPADLVARLRLALRTPIELGEHSVSITAGVGVAESGQVGEGAEALLSSAQLAMHQARTGGIDRTAWFQDELREHALQRLTLEVEIRAGLARDEFVPYYQPRVRLEDGAIVGAEALARWERTDGRNVPPDVFISVAEDSRLIEQLGARILHVACTDAQTWQRRIGRPIPVSVNVSARQLGDDRFPRLVAEELARSGLPPEHLRLEITETAVLADLGRAVQLLTQLKELGVTLSLDDFGTGYSSPMLLRRLPLDEMKIDRSFVADLSEDAGTQAIVRGMCGMGAGLGIDVVAEGVETERDAAFLREIACPYGQGFLWSPAIPAPVFLALLEHEVPPWALPTTDQEVTRR